MSGREQTVEFVTQVFGPATTELVYVCSLPNDDAPPSEPGERRLMTRDIAAIVRFVEKWDRPHRALYFCVGTIRAGAQAEKDGGSPRCKANVAEMHCLHADIDLKDVALSCVEIEAKLSALPLPPSAVVRSGNGVHAYWLLNEPESDVERVEAALRQIADLVGGDLKVAEIARLMRLPGSHNTKRGQWLPVEIVRGDYGRRYELSDLEDMLGYMSPVIRRKDHIGDVTDDVATRFLNTAKRLGFKPPIDVERRLAAMRYQGSGDSSIHETQLQISASLLNHGTDLEEVVDILIEATRAAAGEYAARWNWQREERAIRRMCEDWVKKHPPAQEKAVDGQAAETRREEEQIVREAVGGGSMVSLTEARAKRDKGKQSKMSDKTPQHIIIGTAVIDVMRQRGDQLLVTEEQVWRYRDGLWSTPTSDGRRWLDFEIETGCRALGVSSKNNLMSETRQWILRHPDLYKPDVPWDLHGKIPVRGGLVDPGTLQFEPSRLDHYATWRIECEFDGKAECPWWLVMLNDAFADREPELRAGTIETIQDMLGVALIEDKPKALTKALVLHGGSDSGKTSILEVLGGLLSKRPISMSLDAISNPHGLMEFVRRAPWVLNEAFDQSKWHFSSLVKSILTGDPVQINIKSGPLLTQRIKAPVFWGTNHPPQFKEATKAIVNRMVVIPCRQVFEEGQPKGAAAEARRMGYSEPATLVLETEMAGVLNWAIAGLRRAKGRGFLSLTSEIEATRVEIRSESNLVDGFFRECVELSESVMVATPDFCAAFTVWWHENKGENRNSPSNDAIGKALASMGDARICPLRDAERRYYLGVGLNRSGLDYWQAASSSSLAEGKTSRITDNVDRVNRTIPASWTQKDAVVRMRKAFERRKTPPSDPPRAAPENDDGPNDTCEAMTLQSVTLGIPVF